MKSCAVYFPIPNQPSYTTFARRVQPTSFGWHWPGLQDCASQYHAHGGQGELRTHLGGSSDFHAGAGTPPIPVYTSMTPRTISALAAAINGTSCGKTVFMIVWFIPNAPCSISAGGIMMYTSGIVVALGPTPLMTCRDADEMKARGRITRKCALVVNAMHNVQERARRCRAWPMHQWHEMVSRQAVGDWYFGQNKRGGRRLHTSSNDL